MNTTVNNQIPNTLALRPKSIDPKDQVDTADHDLEESRKIGEELGLENPQEAKSFNQEDKAVQALTGVANLGRKIGSKALNVTGFLGVTASALSYILFRFKILSAAIAAPALGAFYIANNLKAAAKESEKKSGLISDPGEIIKKAKEDSTYLESNFRKVIAAMVKVGEMKDTDPKKELVLKDLRKVAKKVGAKRTELNKIDQSSNQLLKIKHFMDIYNDVKADKTQLETASDEQIESDV